MRRLRLSCPTKRPASCRVTVGRGALAALEEDLDRELRGRGLIIVSDDRVAPLHGSPLCRRLAEAGWRVELVTFPAGEPHKTRSTKQRLEDRLLEIGADRQSVVLAVGGGVTGDLAAFVAATWHRGVPVIQVPTSLLAMVDASIGGKAGVNLADAKNIVGVVQQPWGVYIDPELLATLPDTDFRDGFAEIVKAGVIADAVLFRWLEANVEPLLARDAEALAEAIERSVRIKARFVQADERETGRRAALNFGHTVAHAIEVASGYTESHGRAVATGMCVEARLAHEATGFSAEAVARLDRLVARFGLPVGVPEGLAADALIAVARHDKKNRDGRIHCALPQRLGRMPAGARVTSPVSESTLREAIERV